MRRKVSRGPGIEAHQASCPWVRATCRSTGRAGASSPSGAAAPYRTESHSSICAITRARSEEHTSELQSRGHLVCRLLLEKKNTLTKSNGLTFSWTLYDTAD